MDWQLYVKTYDITNYNIYYRFMMSSKELMIKEEKDQDRKD